MTTAPEKFTTTNAGAPVESDEHSLTQGEAGGILLHDHYLIEKMAQFNRERVPERVVHAKGGGAFGEFEVNDEIQLDLLLDYQTNVALYDTIQAYLREHQPPILAVWGKNDPFFIPPGAEAFRRDVPEADVRFVESGHFALETHAAEIGAAMREFLARHVG